MSQSQVRLNHPSTMLVCGPTGCGKTRFVLKLITHNIFEPLPTRLIWIYSQWQPLYQELQSIKPNIEFVKCNSKKQNVIEQMYDSLLVDTRNLIVLDDQMGRAGDSPILADLFTEGSHHRNLTIIYIVQNLFDKGKAHRNASLNSAYLVVFKNPRDRNQVRILGNQCFGDGRFLAEAFADATREPYGYLLIDTKAVTPEEYRTRTKIFPDDGYNVVYVPSSLDV